MSRPAIAVFVLRPLALILLCAVALPSGQTPAQAKPAQASTVSLSVAANAPGSRYLVGQPVQVTVSETNPTAVSHTYDRQEIVTDYYGNVTTVLSDTVTLAPAAHVSDIVPLSIAGAGYFEFRITLTDQTSRQQLTSFAPIGIIRAQQTGLDPKSAFGVNGTLAQAYGTNAGAMSTAAASMAAAGIRYDREEINWQSVETKPGSGQFSFARTDSAIVAAHDAGIQVLGLLAYWSSLPQPDTTQSISGTALINTITGCSRGPVCAYTPQGNALFASYSAAVVNHYKPGGALAKQQGWTDGYGITDWEVWNEPSTNSFWRHDLANYPTLFANLYNAASTAIRQADGTANVMYDESGSAFSTAIKATNATSQILAVHTYSGGLDPDSSLSSPTLPRGGQGTAPAALGSIAAQGLPVWITETGYATNGTVTPRQQAQYLVRSYVDFQAQSVLKNFWFKFREDSPGGDNLYGITSQNGAPKPAYIAYATMARHLQDATYAASAQVGTAVRAILYTRADGSTEAVLWSTAENGTMAIPTDAGQSVAADDITDNPVGQVAAAALTVPLSGDPVFLTVTGTTAANLKTVLEHATIAGINPVGPLVSMAPGLSNGLPNVNVAVSARINVPISGTVTLALPTGWTAPVLSKRFPTLQPGHTTSLSFRLNAEINHPDDALSALAKATTGMTGTISISGTTGMSPTTGISATAQVTNTDRTPVTPYALTYGHPTVDGTLATWSTASTVGLVDLRPNQVVGIPAWTPQNLSAKVYTMWDEKYFYLAADVLDQSFHYAPIGYNMYQGDSIQYGWGMDANAWLRDAGQNRYNVTAGLTRQGPANFQYNLLGPWQDMQVQIKPDPASGHLIYTTAVPWSRLGNFTPKNGKQFAFDLLINQNDNGTRIGWIQISPGMGIGFFPSQFPLWTLIGKNPAAGLRLGGLVAPNQGTVTFNLPAAHGQLVVHNGGMRAIMLTIDGTPVSVANSAGKLAPFGDTTMDISKWVHAGDNTVTASGTGMSKASAAVLSFFQ